MASNFPTSLDSFTDPASTDKLNSPAHATLHANKHDAIEKLEAKVGVDTSAVDTSIDYFLNHASGTFKTHRHTGTGSTKVYVTDLNPTGLTELHYMRVASGGAALEGVVDPYSAWVTASDGATVTFNLNSGKLQKVTLGGNRTLAISNEVDGKTFVLKLIQDGTGSKTVTWFSTITWAGGITPTLTTTASKADVFGFMCTGTDTYDGFVIGQNL